MNRLFRCTLFLLFLFLLTPSYSANIGDLDQVAFLEASIRFWTFQDMVVIYALIGIILMAICCGILGSFLVVRRLSLVGDTLSHAVLPGVALAFMWTGYKDPWIIFIGAVLSGLIGIILVYWIQSRTHLKNDAALGLVLSGFYALGITLFTIVQRYPQGNKSGINTYLFGQAAAISEVDIIMMALITFTALIIIYLFYKEFLIVSFDSSYAKSLGIITSFFHYILILMLAFAVVVALQATGVILVSAMLIIPPATASLLTNRFHHLIFLSILFGIISGTLGAYISFLDNNLPTGPFIVVSAGTLFLLVFLFAPRNGVISKFYSKLKIQEKIQSENLLKYLYSLLEKQNFINQYQIPLHQLSPIKHQSSFSKILKKLIQSNLLSSPSPSIIELTPAGLQKAKQIVRNHRLWELYLAREAHYPADHVHDDAEKIEHILSDDNIASLEKLLNYPQFDPHGKPIPHLPPSSPPKH